MRLAETNTTLKFYPKGDPRRRLFALGYFTILLTVWNILGHTILGFEQSWAHLVAGLVTALVMQFLLEWLDAWGKTRPVRFMESPEVLVGFLAPAIIPGLACSMLLYPNESLAPIIFAAALSIASKVLFRAPVGGGRTQHFFNPSNVAIVATLLLFPWVGVAPAYHFTENVTGIWHWLIPVVILVSGIVLHSLYTGRLVLCLSWVGGFALQAVLRNLIFGSPLIPSIAPVTGAAFIVFTLYMIPDPATTPINPKRQAAFGLAVAIVYGILQIYHVVFGLFIALLIVSAVRGLGLIAYGLMSASRTRAAQPLDGRVVAASGD